MKYIVCYSGGHSSALVAIEAVRKYGKENVILLNHNISSKVEHHDIKRFKQEVADYLEIEITYANMKDFEQMTPIDIALKINGFQIMPGSAFCTYNLKTKPFYKYLEDNCQDKENFTILYGFDAEETDRIERKKDVMRAKGYKVEFPIAKWERTILDTKEIGIEKPTTYRIFKHANCIGCLKAGRQHWYVVYCLRRDIFDQAMQAEEIIGHSIIGDILLKDLIPIYEDVKSMGICPNDRQNGSSFWANVNRNIPEQMSFIPCDCALF